MWVVIDTKKVKMTKNIFMVAAMAILINTSVFAQNPAHISLVYPLSTNGKQAPESTNGFSLNILQGISKNENNFSMSGLAGIVKNDARGFHISGVYHYVGNQLSGVQMAGIANYTRHTVKGLQLAGAVNMTQNGGTQVSGLVNTAKNVTGVQLTGTVNLADTVGTQITGLVNIAQKVEGVQISSVWNQAEDVHSQVSGIVNRAKKVKGVQVGFINIADSSDYAIGLVNIIKNGERSLSVSYDETGSAILSFRSGGKTLYGILGLGYNTKFLGDNIFAAEAGIGAKVLQRDYFTLRAEGISQTLSRLKGDSYNKTSLRVLPSVKLGDQLELFAGPSLNFAFLDNDEKRTFVKKTFWKSSKEDTSFASHIGFTAGLMVKM